MGNRGHARPGWPSMTPVKAYESIDSMSKPAQTMSATTARRSTLRHRLDTTFSAPATRACSRRASLAPRRSSLGGVGRCYEVDSASARERLPGQLPAKLGTGGRPSAPPSAVVKLRSHPSLTARAPRTHRDNLGRVDRAGSHADPAVGLPRDGGSGSWGRSLRLSFASGRRGTETGTGLGVCASAE